MDSLKKQLQSAIANNKIDFVLEKLGNNENSEVSEEAVLLSARWKQLKDKEMLGLIAYNEVTTIRNQIVHGLLGIIRKLPGDQPAAEEKAVTIETSNIIYRGIFDANAESKATKTILFISATPRDKQVLRFDRELQKIKESLREHREIKLESEFAVQPDEILRLLKRYKPAIVHLSMHGSKGKGLFFVDENNEEFPISADILASFFELINFGGQRTVECLLISACNSFDHAKASSQFVQYAIGMRDLIPDEVSAEFSAGFYDGISSGDDYPLAFRQGILRINLWASRNTYESNMPLKEVPYLFDPNAPQVL